MNMKQEDTKIKRLYDRLRSENQADAPEFHELITRSERNMDAGFRFFRLPMVLSLLAMFVVVGALIYFSFQAKPEIDEEVQVAAISDWESPTDFLLENPNSSLWDSIPSIEDDLADWDETEEEANQ